MNPPDFSSAPPGDLIANMATPSSKADISRIIKYAPAELIGREAELKLLHDAWAGRFVVPPSGGSTAADRLKPGLQTRPRVLTFVALGGEGKTSLVTKWAAELAQQCWPGCDTAFAWSFYSQGTREQVAASSDIFLKEALTFFGEPVDRQFAASNAGAYEKGQCLARLVGQRRSLLILDGLEPLQYGPTAPTPGELKDQGLAALLKGLAATSHGLCVVTTRYSIPDLRAYWQNSAPEVKLLRLSQEGGVAMLKQLGVKGNQKECETLVEDVQGHALTLNLLGTYLREAHAGDIRKRNLVKLEEADAEEQGGHAFRVMDAYVKALEEEVMGRTDTKASVSCCSSGLRALAVLRLIGLFDRPATADCLAALLKAPAVPGLTEAFFTVEKKWLGLKKDYYPVEAGKMNLAFTRLENAKLLTVNRDAAGTLLSLDAHPLLREYFARQLREKSPGAWRAAHRRLYKYLCAATPDKPKPTLEDLQPLFQAVAHGWQAGLHQQACKKVYRDRIQRGREAYSTRKLGAHGSDLGAIACFFEPPWSRVSPALSRRAQAWLLNEAASSLRALGRLTEALDPMRAAAEMTKKLRDWKNAAADASNLSALVLTLGEVAGAVGDAEQSVTYADRSGDWAHKMGKRAVHANALHQAGRRAEAEARFREAEQMQAESQPYYPLLYSVQGFWHCDLLLAEAECAAWQTLLGRSLREEADSDTPDDGTAKREGSLRLLTASPAGVESCRAISERAAQTLKWEEEEHWLLDIALDHLTLGRAALYAAMLSPRSSRGNEAPFSKLAIGNWKSAMDQSLLTSAATELDDAVDGLRRAGQLLFLPGGLLTRAWLRFLTGASTGSESAQADLDEAWEIAERGPMRLFLADIHLHRARLFFREKPYLWTSPQADLATARKLIEQCGYGRRREELEDAEKVVGV